MKVDIVLMAALGLEKDAAERVLSLESIKSSYSGINDTYAIYQMKNGLRVAIGPPTGMGQINAAIATSRMLLDLHPSITVLIGIAGCMERRPIGKGVMRGKPTLGDLVVSSQIHDYELQKLKNGIVEPRWQTYKSDPTLLPLIQSILHDASWVSALSRRPDEKDERPRIHVGDVLSGNVVLADRDEKNELKAQRPTAIAIEMEAAGVASVLSRHNEYNRFLMIKGLCDWAEGNKADDWQLYCSQASAWYTKHLIDTVFPDYLLRLPPYLDEDVFRRHSIAALRCFLESQADCAPFLKQMAEAVFDASISDLYRIIHPSRTFESAYNVEIGTGNQFLLRAKPLFSNAKRIYVTSLDFVSTFWMDDSDTAKDYINAHTSADGGRNVMRLFVFSNPENAHRHAKRLDYHAERFPNTLVCSKKDYIQLITPFIVGGIRHLDGYLRQDFSFSFYETDKGERVYYSGFNGRFLSFKPVRTKLRDGDIDHEKFIERLQEIATTSPGDISPGHHVLKWRPYFYENKEWASRLSAMFGDRNADVMHILSFNMKEQSYDAIRPRLAEIKYQILQGRDIATGSLANRYGIRDVWLLKRLDQASPIRDQVTDGELHYSSSSKMKYMLVIKLSEKAKVRAFMEDPDNARLRFELFSHLGGDITEFMQILNINTPEDLQRNTPSGKIYYNVLESLASANVRRFDYIDDELIEEIVKTAPPPF